MTKTAVSQEAQDAMSAEELWDYCMTEYKSGNPLTKFLLANQFAKYEKLLSSIDFSSLLEVGCGAGESAKKIWEMLDGQKFEISDYDKRYVEILSKQKLPYRVSQESVYSLKREDNSFDVVIIREVLEHLDDPGKALEECFRVAKKYVILSVPNEPLWSALNVLRGKYWSSLGNTPGHINAWSPWSLKRLVSRYGSVKRVLTPVPWTLMLCEKKSK